jgi:hypothetical protein
LGDGQGGLWWGNKSESRRGERVAVTSENKTESRSDKDGLFVWWRREDK